MPDEATVRPPSSGGATKATGPVKKAAPPSGGTPTPGGGNGGGPAVINKKIPESPFHSGLEDRIPDLDLSPLEDLKTKITPEYCLEAAARVLEDLGERQEDTAWTQQYITLADEWKGMAQMLIDYRIQTYQLAGEAHLKQQEMYFARDLHAQQLAHNDQKHLQSMSQSDEQHKKNLQQKDEEAQARPAQQPAAKKSAAPVKKAAPKP